MNKRNYPPELAFLENKKQPIKTTHASLKDKWIIITGATSGVGYQAALICAKNHAQLVLVARNEQKANAVAKELFLKYQTLVKVVIADFSDLNQVVLAANKIKQEIPVVDVLINCAGLHSTTKKITKEGHELVFAVNHLASFSFTVHLLDHLNKSKQARVLHINSEGHRFNGLDINDLNWKKRIYTGLRGYGASKTAQLLCMLEMSDEYKDTSITFNAMHPGDVKTNIGQNNGFLYRLFSKLVIQRALDNPEKSGLAIYYLIAEPTLSQITGKFFHLTTLEQPAKHATDRNKSKLMYKKTKEILGL